MSADDGTRHDRAMTRTDTPPPPVGEPARDGARPVDAAEIDSAEWSIWAGWETAGRMHTSSGGAVPASPATGASVAGPPTPPPRSDAYRTADRRPVHAATGPGATPSGQFTPSDQSTAAADDPSGNGPGAAAAVGAAGSAGSPGSGPTKVAARAERTGGPTPPGGRRPAPQAAPDPAGRRRALAVGGLWAACLLVGLLVGGLTSDDDGSPVNVVEIDGNPDDWRSAPAPGSTATDDTADDEPGRRPDRPDRPDDPRRTTTTLDPTATTAGDGSSTTTTEPPDREPPAGEEVTTTTSEPDGSTTTTTDGDSTTTSTSTTSPSTTTTTATTTTTTAGDAALGNLIPF